jgi:hypothetical protein
VANGSLVRTLDILMRPQGKTLVPFKPPALSVADRELAKTHVLDPHRPEAMAESFVRALRQVAPVRTAAFAALALACIGVLTWRWACEAGLRGARKVWITHITLSFRVAELAIDIVYFILDGCFHCESLFPSALE